MTFRHRHFRHTQPLNWRAVLFLILCGLVGFTKMEEPLPNIECPSHADNSACPCYKFEDGKSKLN